MPTWSHQPSREQVPQLSYGAEPDHATYAEPVATHDPLAEAAPLIRRVYAYVAFRIGDGPDAEDVTSEVFERALRYRAAYDPKLGSPIAWLIGIARRCIGDRSRPSVELQCDPEEWTMTDSIEAAVIERIELSSALRRVDQRSQHLLALRYGADLSPRELGRILPLNPNAGEVALPR